MKITLPEGFQVPSTAKPGQPFEVVATIVMGEDGAMLTSLDGMELAEEEEEGEEEEAEYAQPEITLPFEGQPPAPMA
jgi:hypothetical protein